MHGGYASSTNQLPYQLTAKVGRFGHRNVVNWRFQFSSGPVHEVQMQHVLNSHKKVVYFNTKQVHVDYNSRRDWEFTCALTKSLSMTVLVDYTSRPGVCQYDMRIGGISFRRFPKQHGGQQGRSYVSNAERYEADKRQRAQSEVARRHAQRLAHQRVQNSSMYTGAGAQQHRWGPAQSHSQPQQQHNFAQQHARQQPLPPQQQYHAAPAPAPAAPAPAPDFLLMDMDAEEQVTAPAAGGSGGGGGGVPANIFDPLAASGGGGGGGGGSGGGDGGMGLLNADLASLSWGGEPSGMGGGDGMGAGKKKTALTGTGMPADAAAAAAAGGLSEEDASGFSFIEDNNMTVYGDDDDDAGQGAGQGGQQAKDVWDAGSALIDLDAGLAAPAPAPAPYAAKSGAQPSPGGQSFTSDGNQSGFSFIAGGGQGQGATTGSKGAKLTPFYDPFAGLDGK